MYDLYIYIYIYIASRYLFHYCIMLSVIGGKNCVTTYSIGYI